MGRKATGRGTGDLFAGGLKTDLGSLPQRHVPGVGGSVGGALDLRQGGDGVWTVPTGAYAGRAVTFPVMQVRMVPASKVRANDYNPNKVAEAEMALLALSILEDGMTQPCVTFYDPESDMYEVVDGFHRYTVLTKWFGVPEIPVVVIDKPLAARMASTVRHNRARGKHQVDLQAELVKKLVAQGWDDARVGEALGMSADEVVRLKQIVGIARMCAGASYSRAFGGEGEFLGESEGVDGGIEGVGEQHESGGE